MEKMLCGGVEEVWRRCGGGVEVWRCGGGVGCRPRGHWTALLTNSGVADGSEATRLGAVVWLMAARPPDWARRCGWWLRGHPTGRGGVADGSEATRLGAVVWLMAARPPDWARQCGIGKIMYSYVTVTYCYSDRRCRFDDKHYYKR